MTGLAGERDRVSIWTANIPAATTDLTRGFKAAKAAAVTDSLTALRQELPLGDTDLKDALARAAAAFDGSSDRRRAIIFLGDGMSIHNPISATDRSKLSAPMVAKEIEFVAVPLGPRVDGANLNGLASSTGGTVLTLTSGDKVNELAKDMFASLATPVLYPPRSILGIRSSKHFRPFAAASWRRATLVIGKAKNGSSVSTPSKGVSANSRSSSEDRRLAARKWTTSSW